MSRTWLKIMAALLCGLIFFSCRVVIDIDSVEKQLFLEENMIGCYKDGHDYLVYSPVQHQMALNSQRHTVRLQDDKQDLFLHIEMESYPKSIGVSIIADLAVRGGDGINKYTLVFECSKIEGGLIWLWNKENKLGIIVPEH